MSRHSSIRVATGIVSVLIAAHATRASAASPAAAGATATVVAQATPEKPATPPATGATEKPTATPAPAAKTSLLDPKAEAVNQKAPTAFKVKFETSKGNFTVEVHRDWAPLGADRFYNLVNAGFFDGCRFYRVVKNFMVQFGINGDPKVTAAWRSAKIQDDPVKESNKRGYVTYAMAGPNTRTTQLFINFKDNSRLDPSGFSPFGQVTEGMEIVDAIYADYGDMPQQGGNGPDPGQMETQGNGYLLEKFPKLDYIKTAKIMK
jgi:cyclophilin family peptidyl-prolyl cis-trans isomerase